MAKRIAFYVMCTLLVLVVILTGIVIRRVSRIILWSTPQDPISTNAPTTPTAPQTTEPTNTTEPTDPSHVHTFELTNSIKATCEGYGWNIYTCTGCGFVDMPLEERQEPLGHDNGPGETTPATCTEAGYITYTCQRCFRINTSTQGSALDHSFTAQTQIPPTCTEDGYTTIHCSREGCQEVLETVRNEGTATGHTYGAWTYGLGGSAKPLCCVCFADWSGLSSGIQPGVYTIVSHSRRILQHPTDGPLSLYEILVSIPNDPNAATYMYSIYDYLDNGTLVFYYDAQLGLVVRYCDQYDQLFQISTNSVLSESITIRPSEAPEEPTEEPTTAPTEPADVPTEPVEIPTEPTEAPTEPAEEPTEPAEEATDPVEEPIEPTEDLTEAA